MSTNHEALGEAAETQRRTQQSLQRIQQQLNETNEVGTETLTSLESQRDQASKVTNELKYLDDRLNKTKKLQDRFARWSLNFGTQRQARKMVQSDKKGVKAATPDEEITANQPIDLHSSIGTVSKPSPTSENLQPTTIENSHAPRNELFGSSNRARKLKPRGKTKPQKSEAIPLSAEEQRRLDLIEADDRELDEGFDLLSSQVQGLLSIAVAMNDETDQQKGMIDGITVDLERTTSKQAIANNRARLFTMNRGEKRQKNRLRETAASKIK